MSAPRLVNRSLAIRLSTETHTWLVERQEALFEERGVRVPLSEIVRSILEQARLTPPNGKERRKVT